MYGHPRPDGGGFVPPPFGTKILPRLVLARKLYAYGPQVDYFDAPHCVGFTRQGEPPAAGDSCAWRRAGLAVVMTNAREAAVKAMCVGRQHAGEVWTDVLGGCWGQVRIDAEGWGVFPSAPRSVAVWTHCRASRRGELDGLVL